MHVNEQPVAVVRRDNLRRNQERTDTRYMVALTLTCSLSRIPGSKCTVASAPAATVALHWAGLSGSTFQPGRNGAAMSAGSAC